MLWILGGLDPTGGAGVLRDHATARRFDPTIPTRTIVTAWTRQGHGAPAEAWPVDRDALVRQLGGLPEPHAIKLGLVPAPLVPIVHARLAALAAPIVLDPVLRASDGGALGATHEALAPLLHTATLVTPNREEAEHLASTDARADEDALLTLLRTRWPAPAWLLKGGHAHVHRDRVVDLLAHAGGLHRFDRARNPGPDPRGTGCTLATAIAIGLARGVPLEAAVANAIAWLDEARSRARSVGTDGVLLE